MPVPVPRQRAIPAVESGQAQAAPAVGGPSEEETVRNEATTAENHTTHDGTTRSTALNATPADGVPLGVTTTGTGAGVSNPGTSTAGVATAAHTTLTLLLIEDDPTAAPIVHDLLDADGRPIRVRTARNLTEAERLLTHDVHCILLDLALPAPGRAGGSDDELAVLRHVLRLAPRHAVLALTASGD
ncbi:hypothetical protein AB0M34_36795, partial [Nocardia sp. NPDC050193]